MTDQLTPEYLDAHSERLRLRAAAGLPSILTALDQLVKYERARGAWDNHTGLTGIPCCIQGCKVEATLRAIISESEEIQ